LLINNGTISGTTNVRFNSLVAGTGSYGPVNLFDNAVFMPGATASRSIFSPAAVTVAGGVAFSADTSVVVERGGSQPGTQYDRILTTGPASLDGTLEVRLAEALAAVGPGGVPLPAVPEAPTALWAASVASGLAAIRRHRGCTHRRAVAIESASRRAQDPRSPA
jgi:hypothetical protein